MQMAIAVVGNKGDAPTQRFSRWPVNPPTAPRCSPGTGTYEAEVDHLAGTELVPDLHA